MPRVRVPTGWRPAKAAIAAAMCAATIFAGPAFATAAPASAADPNRHVPVTDAKPLLVFAAASLQGPLDAAADAWTAQSGVRVVVSYAATPALARQIDQGAPAHIVISADAAWMDWLAERGRIDPGTRVDLLGNSLVLVAPRRPATEAAVERGASDDTAVSPVSFLPRGLGETGRLAVADVYTVPAGRYAKQALVFLGRWDAVAGRLAMGDSVRVALSFVARGEAPLGIVYASDARMEPRVRVVATFAADTHTPIVYPAARVAGEKSQQADCFLDFLMSDEAAARFRDAGFVPLAAGPGGAVTRLRGQVAHRPRCAYKASAPAPGARGE